MRKPGGGYWTCTFADDFNGSTLNRAYWTPLVQPVGAGPACTVDDPRTVAVRDGGLQLTVLPTASDLKCPALPDGTHAAYASGSVSTFWKFSQQYGRFEARVRSAPSAVPGLQEAFWLWPDVRYSSGTWPAAGEIDVAETYSQYPDLTVPFLHYTANDNGGAMPGLNTAWNCAASRGVFHTYTLEWTAYELDIYVDGTLCMSNTAGASSFRKRFIINFTQALGLAGNGPTSETPLPATMTVDYIHVWK